MACGSEPASQHGLIGKIQCHLENHSGDIFGVGESSSIADLLLPQLGFFSDKISSSDTSACSLNLFSA